MRVAATGNRTNIVADATFEIRKDTAGKFRWDLEAANHPITADSGLPREWSGCVIAWELPVGAFVLAWRCVTLLHKQRAPNGVVSHSQQPARDRRKRALCAGPTDG
jgi:hypothetical protein